MQATLTIPEGPRPGEHDRSALAVFLLLLVGLALGWAVKASIEGRTASFGALDGALTLSYPAVWTAGTGDGALLSVTDRQAASVFNPVFAVYSRDLAEGKRLIDAATAWTLGRVSQLPEFRDLGTEETMLAGRAALRINYAYVAEPPAGAGRATLPIVVLAADTIVVQGKGYLVFSSASDASAGEVDPRLSSIMASVKLK